MPLRTNSTWSLRVTDRSLWITVVLVFALVLVNAGLMERNLDTLFSNIAWMAHAREVLTTLTRISTLSSQAEIDALSYLATRDHAFADSYGHIRPQVSDRLGELEALTANEPNQHARTVRLEERLRERLSEIDAAITLSDGTGADPRHDMTAAVPRDSFNAVRALILEMQSEERDRYGARLDNSRRTYLTTVASVIGGAMTGIFLVVIVAVLIRQSIALRDSGRRFLRASLDALPSHIAVLDERGNILEVNAAWRETARLHGLRGPALEIGQNYVAGFERRGAADPDSAVAARGIRDVLSGLRGQFSMRYPSEGQTGRRWFHMQVTRFRQRDGPLRLVVAHEDLTQQVLAELAMRRRSNQLQRLAVASSQIGAARDIDTAVAAMTANARALVDARWALGVVQLPGRTRASAINIWDQFDDRRLAPLTLSDQAFAALLERVAAPLRRTQSQIEADADWHDVRGLLAELPNLNGLIALPLVGRSGGRHGLLLLSDCMDGEFSDDDTAVLVQLSQVMNVALDNARLYEELRDADRRKDEFLATLSHELRNPLAPIRNSLRTMAVASDAGLLERSRGVIDRQVSHMVRLIDDLLDISRITRGKLELRLDRVMIQDAIHAALETTRPLIDDAGHDLALILPPEPVYVLGDDARLAQIFSNLLNNAAKYTPPGGRITVEAALEGPEIAVRVRDTGLGIPADKLPGIFDMFSQLDQSAARAQGGLGIGLALVKRLVEMHGGRVVAASAGAGRGSAFEIRLPTVHVDVEIDVPADKSSGFQVRGRARRVLVVDDNRDATESLVTYLSIAGHNVEGAYDGLEAIERATASHPDIVLLDIGLPKMNGYEAAQRIRAQSRGDVVLVAVTGWGQEPDRVRAREAGFDVHLTKPVDPAALVALIEELG
jgi:signal transduction histidine kinase/CHASE3 domain sensor protein